MSPLNERKEEFLKLRKQINKLYISIEFLIAKLVKNADEEERKLIADYIDFTNKEREKYIKYRDFENHMYFHEKLRELVNKYHGQLIKREDWGHMLHKDLDKFKEVFEKLLEIERIN